jgi:hypothetical protein
MAQHPMQTIPVLWLHKSFQMLQVFVHVEKFKQFSINILRFKSQHFELGQNSINYLYRFFSIFYADFCRPKVFLNKAKSKRGGGYFFNKKI